MDNENRINSVVFYWSTINPIIGLGSLHKIKDRIRYELHPGKTVMEALEAAKPAKYEVVLNSVEIN